jgi:hypothetical protein
MTTTTSTSSGSNGQLEDIVVEREGIRYLVRILDDHLSVHRQTPAAETWRDAEVPIEQLGGEARRALVMADRTSAALLIGLKGVVAAAVLRNTPHAGGRSR